MKSLTPTQRDRGLQRLRQLTFAATAGASMAVIGMSYVAAASYAGQASNSSNTALNSSTSSQSSTTSSDSLATATAAPTTAGNGSGTVTSGGS